MLPSVRAPCGTIEKSGRGAAWLARLLGVQEVPGSNPGGPTKYLIDLQTAEILKTTVWSPGGVQNGRRITSPPSRSNGQLRRFDTPEASLLFQEPDKPDKSRVIK